MESELIPLVELEKLGFKKSKKNEYWVEMQINGIVLGYGTHSGVVCFGDVDDYNALYLKTKYKSVSSLTKLIRALNPNGH